MKLRIVPARAGLQWVRLGIGVFWRQPMAFSVLFFTSMAAVSLVSVLLPLIGPAVAQALMPMIVLMVMAAAAQANQGRAPTPALLLVAARAARQSLPAMLTLGALFAVGDLLATGATALVDGGQFALVTLGRRPFTPELAQSADFQAAMALWLLLYALLSLPFWHAPALAHWHRVPPVKAMFFSTVACLRNMGAFTLYGLAWGVVFVGAGIAISIAVTLLVLAGLGMGMAGGILAASVSMLMAMVLTSVVFTFRDCFEPPDKPAASPAPPDAAM